jgi:hypothetical protein
VPSRPARIGPATQCSLPFSHLVNLNNSNWFQSLGIRGNSNKREKNTKPTLKIELKYNI